MKVRKANEGDARRIAEIHVRAWRAAYRGILSNSLLDSLSVSDSLGPAYFVIDNEIAPVRSQHSVVIRHAGQRHPQRLS